MENYIEDILTSSYNEVHPSHRIFFFLHKMQQKELLSIILQRPEAKEKKKI